jgi:hypothetical protein
MRYNKDINQKIHCILNDSNYSGYL